MHGFQDLYGIKSETFFFSQNHATVGTCAEAKIAYIV